MANANIIVPYVLDSANAKRLEIAVEIVKSYPEVKHKIVCDFLNALQSSALSILKIRVPSMSLFDETREHQGGFPWKKSILFV